MKWAAETRAAALPPCVWVWVKESVFWSKSWHIHAGYWAPGLGVFVFNIGACLLFFEALRRSPLSVTIPILAFVPVFAALGGWFTLQEHLLWQQWVAVALVGLGALFLNTVPDDYRRPLHFLGSLGRETGSLLMIGVALCWAATSVLDKMAMEHCSPEMHAGVQTLAMGVVLTLWLSIRGRSREMLGVMEYPAAFFGGVAVAVVALGLQLYALQILYVGLMEGIKRAFGIVMAIVLGRLLFGEALSSGKIVAGILMGGGVFLLSQ